jgi:hypothetical protein
MITFILILSSQKYTDNRIEQSRYWENVIIYSQHREIELVQPISMLTPEEKQMHYRFMEPKGKIND